MTVVGLDTSNYTTSVAVFDGCDGHNEGRLLDVRPGELGLRQSDALFQHVKRLPELFARMGEQERFQNVAAVGASTRPRAVDGSYMPCFMVGYSHAKLLSDALGVPLFEVSHQQGHVAACLFSAGRMDLMDKPHLAWHLSGGTTELLRIEPDGKNVKATRIGGTTDISAGQLIDRAGVMLNLQFPAGRHLDALAKEAVNTDVFKVKCPGLEFSLSGVQNKVQQYAEGNSPAETAAYTLRAVCHAVQTATRNAQKLYPGLEVVFSGGVSANSMLRAVMKDAIFCDPQYSTDNALGVAVLAARLGEG